MYCRVQGCQQRCSRWGTYCNTHKSRNRRHGDPNQQTITTSDLKPHLSATRARIDRNQGQPLWPLLEDRWATLLDHCRSYLAMCERGVPFHRHQRTACYQVLKLADTVEPRIVVEVLLALFLMLDQEPRRFTSDRAFRFQLVRRVRGLSDVKVGEYYDHRSGKV